MDINEPEIKQEEILVLQDENFSANNVCIVTGAGTGIGRATVIAAAANNLMVAGLDINEEEGEKTQKMAREMGGQMAFIKTDLTKDEDIEHALTGAAMLGTIHDLVYIADLMIHSAGHSLRTLCQPQVFAPKGK